MLENQIAYHVLLQLPKLVHVSGFNDEFDLSWLVCTCTHILGLVGLMTIHTTFKVSTFHCHTYKIIPNYKTIVWLVFDDFIILQEHLTGMIVSAEKTQEQLHSDVTAALAQ